MTKKIVVVSLFLLLLAGCRANPNQAFATFTVQPVTNAGTNTPAPSATKAATATLTPTVTNTPTPTLTPTPVAYGPSNFPDNVDPLTGIVVTDTQILNRRPVSVKVNIVPRTSNRPPWGLSYADIVYDYYHNAGYSRFHAIFYGKNASLVGPIRSGRLLDSELVHMYQSIFAYGSADAIINGRFFNSDFSDRLLLEGNQQSCPPTAVEPFCRFGPETFDILLGDTALMSGKITSEGVSNGRQNLDGMSFYSATPPNGVSGKQVYVRYSGDNYTRWDYDPATGKYLRFQDSVFDTGQGESYEPLTDRLNNQQLSASTVVVVMARHEFFQQPPAEIIEIQLSDTGTAYAFRDGQMYQVQWNRPTINSVLSLTNADGSPFPYKPGQTWFQVVGVDTRAQDEGKGAWRFNFLMP